MANSINDLYSKYVNRVGRTLESDRYFQYLYEMTQAGKTNLQQKNVVLHKVVDERWLTIIEESLDAINTIIEKPRRFITTKEEVVPVSLARKISAESVRHLSQNTQFIASNENGDIQPTRILNTTTEETYDLYENRFIYHLIQRLVTFIDKRTDVIFWSTGDETENSLHMDCTVDDAYEQIQYRVDMTIKNKKDLLENDSDHMDVFMRIDRVRRLVLGLKQSAFCQIMAGCAVVRSPIQRTNLMMKDPNYRTCYKLWQFLENYDEVGYSIEAQDSTLEFDEEYLLQMHTNFITNYAIFKSLLEDDSRDISAAPVQHRKVVKPKFVKQIKELVVDNRDLPDVEVRRVFVEEVTQAQLDAEAALAEQQAVNEELETTNVQLQHQLMIAQQQAAEAMADIEELQALAEENARAQKSAETAAAQAEEVAEQADAARQQAETAMQAALEECRQAQQAAQQAQAALEQAQEQARQTVAQAAAEQEALRARQEQQHRNEQQQLAQRYRTERQKLEQAHKQELQQASAAQAAAERKHQSAQKAAAEQHARLEEARRAAEERAEAQRQCFETAQEEQRLQTADRISAMQQEIDELKAALEQERRAAAETLAAEQAARAAAEQRAQQESELRSRVEERAGAASLGQFVRASYAERRERRRQSSRKE